MKSSEKTDQPTTSQEQVVTRPSVTVKPKPARPGGFRGMSFPTDRCDRRPGEGPCACGAWH